MFRSKRGQTLKDSEQFCSSCGTSVGENSAVQKKKNYTLSIMIIFALVVMVTACAWRPDFASDDKETNANTDIQDTNNMADMTDEAKNDRGEDSSGISDEPEIIISDSTFYIGTWYDSVSQRCFMTFEEFGDGSYSVEIHWSSSASMDTVWYLVARSTGKSNELTYENCVNKNLFYDENGNLTDDIIYLDGSGRFYYDGSYLYWQDDKENAGESCKFEKEGGSAESPDDTVESGLGASIIFDTEYYSLELPDYWADLCVYDQWDIEPYAYGIAFYENQSMNDFDGDGGFLFSIALYSNEDDYIDFPDYTYLGQLRVIRLANYDVVVSYPTDVQYSNAGQENYMKLSGDIDGILASFTPQPDVDCEYTPAT